MRWRKANNLLREKPYLLDVYRVRNAAAAQRLARSAGIATASDIMSMAQNRSGMTAEQWTEYVRISEEKISRIDRKAATIRVIGTFELSQRAIITWLLAVAITAFMAITPTGRAWAIALYKTVAEVVNDILFVKAGEKAESDNIPHIEITEEHASGLASLDEASNIIDGYIFCVSPQIAKEYSIVLKKSRTYGDCLKTRYTMDNGTIITLFQYIGAEPFDYVTLDDKKDIVSVNDDNGITLKGVYSRADKACIGSLTYSGITAEITINNLSSKDEIEDLPFVMYE